jgi:hypothetical protein
MAVTIKSRCIIFTAAGDTYPGVLHLQGLTLTTTGGAVGDNLVITDGSGDQLVNYRTPLAASYQDFLFGENYSCRGLTMSVFPTGTAQVLALLR